MSGKKGIILGIVLIIVSLVIGGYEGYQLYTDRSTQEEKETSTSSDVVIENEDDTYEDIDYEEDIDETDETDETEETEETEETDEAEDFIIEGLNEETYDLLNTTEEDLARLLYEWTHTTQDYGAAIGVSFNPDCQINIMEQKYSLSMKTIVGEDSYPEESRVVFLDYYKSSGQYDVHP